MIAAIVPAAGRSVRMGAPKLLLEIGGRTVIERVVRALIDGGAERVLVVSPSPGQEGGEAVALHARRAGADVAPLGAPTDDMRATIEHGLDVLALGIPPLGVLIAPGDAVGLTPPLVRAVVARFGSNPARIAVPVRDGSGGHPIALPWVEAARIAALPPGVGVNALIATRGDLVDRFEVDIPGHDADLDTPEDYRRWAGA
jgi:molybdenum cofactor cytidylyltransferase